MSTTRRFAVATSAAASSIVPAVAAALIAVACTVVPALAAQRTAPPSRPPAPAYLGLPPTSSISSPESWTTVRSFPNIDFDDPTFMVVEPGSDRVFVTEREGRILSFVDDPAATQKTVVLDVREQTQGDSDSGMLSMAFHPQYADLDSPNQGYIYVAYSYRLTSSEDPNDNLPLYFRVSRFHVPPASLVADPQSELVLIEQEDQHLWHEGGAIFFHPGDGFLYITIGDEGGGRCAYNNCQRIDRDLFAGVLRIDVDRIGGDVSHPIWRQPLTGETANYYIPSDNPFVGLTDVLEEFYAIGLRSPHRMSHDEVDDLTWIADVGQSQREEIDILSPGANFQWNWREGTVVFEDHTGIPEPLIGTWSNPILDYGRGLGGTIIGGYVYRGSRYADLYGKYIYTDFLSGRVWALRYARNGGSVSVLENTQLMQTVYRGREDGATSLGVDHDGELHILTLGEPGHIYRIQASPKNPGAMPLLLSQTGLFTDLSTLTPRQGLVPYSVRSALWSDGAGKRRWMSVPTGSTITYSPEAAWVFPAGSVFVKHFEFPISELDPEEIRPLETRVLVMQASGQLYGVTYKWRDDGSDADLVTEAIEDDIVIAAGGGFRTQTYWYPGPNDCLSCHNNGAGQILGIKARQLVEVPADPVLDSDLDQLRWLSEAGFLDIELDDGDIAEIEPLRSLDDQAASLETRVRSYLDSNCSHCHGSTDIDRSLWDGRFTTPLQDQGIVMGELLGDYESYSARVVRPGHRGLSILFQRDSSTDRADRMPPIGRSRADHEFLSVLSEWIDSMPPAPFECPPTAQDPDRCRSSQREKSRLRIDVHGTDEVIRWEHAHGPEVTLADLPDPSDDSGTEYALCIYDSDTLAGELNLRSQCESPSCWSGRTPGMLTYRDDGAETGAQWAQLKAGSDGRSRFSIRGTLPFPSLLPLTTPVAAEMIFARDGIEQSCLRADLSIVRRNTAWQARLAAP
ncbi:MAG TPA: PQQ-dependent sugar dehydrogenase [Candidatus Binatia bacterium]|nr:PQQ-dependent sugar dehydrogenase [Candidatus Binatia bacterium]